MSFQLFENVNYENIKNLFELAKKDSNHLDSIKLQYSRKYQFLQESLNFLIDINLITISNNSVQILSNSNEDFKKILLIKISKKPDYGSSLKSYLENYVKNNNNIYQFIPDPLYNNLTRDLRNFLISTKIIDYENGFYKILDNSILDLIKKIEFSPEQLKKMLDKQNQIGLEAEKIVFKNEIKILKEFNSNFIPVHVSLRDVSAGYDILSYEKDKSNFKKIFIEVKAVSQSNYKFHLSIQETQTANKYKDSYYLYLVPVDYSKPEKFDLKKILKINNIHKNVLDDKTSWKVDSDGFIITKI